MARWVDARLREPGRKQLLVGLAEMGEAYRVKVQVFGVIRRAIREAR